MSYYLNKKNKAFCNSLNSEIFIDKSELIKVTNSKINTNDRFMCVTRPRRFGKTLALSMLNAYYSKGCYSKDIFDNLKISKEKTYLDNLNKHNVIYIDMASLYANLNDKNLFVYKLKDLIYEDLIDAYPTLNIDLDKSDGTFLACAITKINSLTNDTFIFLIDEWDVIFREEETNTNLTDEYIMVLRGLFKAGDVYECIDLVYMTGILPIRRYSSEAALNMFKEYNMLDAYNLTEFVGFTESEVKYLCEKYNRDFSVIKAWYDGYRLNGIELYNPKSVVEAVLTGKCKDHWVNTSARESVMHYMNFDNGVLKDLIVKMLAGEEIDIDPSMFTNDLTKINSSDAALTVLIHLGYLAYDEEKGKCYIPNYEIEQEFERAIRELKWNDIYNPISNSEKLLERTLS